MKTGNVKSRPTDLPVGVWVTPKLNRFVLNRAGFSDAHCRFFDFFSKTRLRGKNPKNPSTKKALGFYSVLVSPVLPLVGETVIK